MYSDLEFFDVIMIKQNKYHQYRLPTLHYKSFWNQYEFMIVINIDGIFAFIQRDLSSFYLSAFSGCVSDRDVSGCAAFESGA